jgi:hypothetical protein
VGALAASVLAACSSSPTSGPTTTTTKPPAVCSRIGNTARSTGASTLARTTQVALLRNVQVQASSCVDEVAFLFSGGTPSWTATYHSGELTLDPSGMPVVVAGRAHLVLTLRPAAGSIGSTPTYDGPTVMSPVAPSGIAEVHRIGDFEGVTRWVIGLSHRRPFEVVTRHDQLVVRLPAGSPRRTRCIVPGAGVSVGYPAGWYAELSPRWACHLFATRPFPVIPASDATTWAVSVERPPESAAAYLASITASASAVTHSARVAGQPATRVDLTTSGTGMLPAGYHFRVYVVATAPRAIVISGTPERSAARVAANREEVDQIAALVRRSDPPPAHSPRRSH